MVQIYFVHKFIIFMIIKYITIIDSEFELFEGKNFFLCVFFEFSKAAAQGSFKFMFPVLKVTKISYSSLKIHFLFFQDS